MKGIFNLDGPFYKWGTEIADIMILSLLWIVCSLPIFTIGASTTALFYVYGKKVRGEDPYIFQHFFKSFKENFKQSTVLTFLLGLLWTSVYLYYQILTKGDAKIWLWVMGIFFMVQVAIVTIYLFPVLSRFDLPIKNLVVLVFVFGNKHLITTVACGVLFVGGVLLVFSASPFSIFAPGIYGLLASYFLQRVFTKYIELLPKDENEEAELVEETEEVEENIDGE